MNKMLVSIFDSEAAADAGLQALHKLHADGDITLYATGVLARDANGKVTVKKSLNQGPIGISVGLMSGPLGVAVGAMTGAVAGAVRDLWAAGVGLDFLEGIERLLAPDKVALVAEVEEEWVMPIDAALEAVGGHVFRHTRTEVADAEFGQDIAQLKCEIKNLEAEALHAHGAAKAKLRSKLATASASIDAVVHRAKQRVEALRLEADNKAESLEVQFSQAKGDVKTKIEDRVKRVKSAYDARGAKLSRAWSLTKDALAP